MSDYGSYCECDGDSTPDFLKDPESTEDFAFNWVASLDGDTIVSSSFTLHDGLTEVSTAQTGSVMQIFLSGGATGRTYRVSNRIVTAGGRTFEKTIRIEVRER